MRRPALQPGLLVNLTLFAPLLLAAQPPEVRLFHEPLNAVATDEHTKREHQSQTTLSEFSPTENQPDNKPGNQTSELELADTTVVSADIPDKGENTVYQYNGYISTASGKHYLINGLPLSSIDSLTLVLVNREGRSLVLKSPSGRTFELSVGQSISKDSL